MTGRQGERVFAKVSLRAPKKKKKNFIITSSVVSQELNPSFLPPRTQTIHRDIPIELHSSATTTRRRGIRLKSTFLFFRALNNNQQEIYAAACLLGHTKLETSRAEH